jgi:hypothetical protein
MNVSGILILGALGIGFFVLPIGLIVLFVQMRAKSRRQMLEGPWTALAQQFGGQLQGERVLVSRDAYQLTLDMRLVSVMQAVGSPYYSDGGTYTEARLELDPRGAHRVATSPRAVRLSPAEIPRVLGDSPLAHLPPGTRIVLADREARVVLPGAVGDMRAIGTAFAGLETLAKQVSTHGPVPLAA